MQDFKQAGAVGAGDQTRTLRAGGFPAARTAATGAGGFRNAAAALEPCTACGLCNAVCPTFAETGDERESPRGRIAMMRYLIAQESENVRQSTRIETAQTSDLHLQRCVGCQACMPACPEGVDYAGALAAVRGAIAGRIRSSRRPRFLDLIAPRLSDPKRYRRLLRLGRWTRAGRRVMPDATRSIEVLASHASHLPLFDGEFRGPGTAATKLERKARIALLPGCTQQVLRPSMTDAAIRLLARRGVDVIVPAGIGCCGALESQLARSDAAAGLIEANLRALEKLVSREGIDHLVSTSAACGAAVRRYRAAAVEAGMVSEPAGEPAKSDAVRVRVPAARDVAAPADRLGELLANACDISELLSRIDIGPPVRWFSLRVGYLGPCTLKAVGVEHDAVATLLSRSGFTVRPLRLSRACCGGRGAFPLAEPELAEALRARALAEIAGAGVDLIAVHDIGCQTHLTGHAPAPIAHIVELVDWAYGGPVPPGLDALAGSAIDVPNARPVDEDGTLG